jgi:hypothetical protein
MNETTADARGRSAVRRSGAPPFSAAIEETMRKSARSIGLEWGRNDAISSGHCTRRQLAPHTFGFVFQPDPTQFPN